MFASLLVCFNKTRDLQGTDRIGIAHSAQQCTPGARYKLKECRRYRMSSASRDVFFRGALVNIYFRI
ncbi:hypothetical protein R5R35_010270 [Gryllus longicercus]|uniref:Uncharacterized protein n=1 Tax=Gryllus longicercus TaxID=2509291 RepID=A0AAN9YZ77_9ORTH